MIEKPFSLDQAFSAETYIYATLHVPTQESLPLYQSTYGWEQFLKIVVNNETKISNVDSEATSESMRYDLRGNRLDSPQRGMNIIRMSDDTVRKVVVK
ncbi:MAG: hypothetical protein K6G08_06400 [Prevotella sp.]|nr:hypothetical protein [Prevotella sp.]